MALDHAGLATDLAFIKVLQGMRDEIIGTAGASTQRIMDVSSNFLSEAAKNGLERFRSMYFSADKVLEEGKSEINRDVDSLVDQIRSQIESSEQSTAGISAAISENQALKQSRLSMAGVQKELEGLITLEEGMKSLLYPALTTMQFEDMMRQRLEHLVDGWVILVMDASSSIDMPDDALGQCILKLLSSNAERRIFYECVLKEPPPPETTAEDETFLGLF